MAGSIFKNRRARDAAIQAIFLVAIVLGLAGAILTARSNLAAQGMTGGFAFLDRATGWNIAFSLIPYTPGDSYARALWIGFLNTIFLSAITIPLATIIGIAIAILRTSGQPVFSIVGASYVETFRNIPLLLQLLFWYSVLTALPPPREAITFGGIHFSGRGIALPWLSAAPPAIFSAILILVLALCMRIAMGLSVRFNRLSEGMVQLSRRILWGIAFGGIGLALWLGTSPDKSFLNLPRLQGLRFTGGLIISPELAACVVAISIYGGAFVAEVIRAGLQSVSKGQIEAAQALGLKGWQIFTRIRFPLAIRAVMPSMANQYIWLTKATTLGIAVGFTDFYMVSSTAINQAGQTLELVGILMGGFFLINYTLAFFLNRVNEAIRLKGSQVRA